MSGGYPLWDEKNKREQEVVCHTSKYKNILNNKRSDLLDLIQPKDLWPYLKESRVITKKDQDRFELNATQQDVVDRLVDFLERNPCWKLHSFFKALSLNNQPHVIKLLGLDPKIYKANISDSPEPGLKMHYYRAPGSNKKVEIPHYLVKAAVTQSNSYLRTIMKAPIFNFEDADTIDIMKCLIQIEADYKKNQKDWAVIKDFQLFDEFLEARPPNTVQLEGKPGDGKTTFFNRYAYQWSEAFQECHENEVECKGHDWMLVLRVVAGSMTGPAKKAIEDELSCKGPTKDLVFEYIIDDGEGILVEYDAVDEMHNEESKKSLAKFTENCQQTDGLKVFISNRAGLCNVSRRFFDRVLKITGFTLDQGIEYLEKYFKEIHGNVNSELLSYIKKRKEHLKFVLCNPLRAHIFAELAAQGKISREEINSLSPVKLLHYLEDHLVRRATETHRQEDAETIDGDSTDHATPFYTLCLQCMLSNVREIPEEMLKQHHIATDSPYNIFLSKQKFTDEHAKDTGSSDLPHEVILEYFAARGLIQCLKSEVFSETKKKMLLVPFCLDLKMANLLELTFGFVSEYETQLMCYLQDIVRASVILQYNDKPSKPDHEITPIIKDLMSSQKDLKEYCFTNILEKDPSPDDSQKCETMWKNMTKAFDGNSDKLQQSFFFASLFATRNDPQYEQDFLDTISDAVKRFQYSTSPDKGLKLWKLVREMVLEKKSSVDGEMHEKLGWAKLALRPFPKTRAAVINLTEDDPSDMQLESAKIVLDSMRMFSTKWLLDWFKKVGKSVESDLSAMPEYENPVVNNIIRCLGHMKAEHQEELCSKTIFKMLPSHQNLNGNEKLSMYPVSGKRWAIILERPTGTHLYAACPSDMLEAVRQHELKPDQKGAILTFGDSSGWKTTIEDGWSLEVCQSLLAELCQNRALEMLVVTGRRSNILHNFMTSIEKQIQNECFPKIFIFGQGTAHLDKLKDWFTRCGDSIILWVSNIGIQVPSDTDEATVQKEHEMLCKEVPGMLIHPVYIRENGKPFYLRDNNWEGTGGFWMSVTKVILSSYATIWNLFNR